MKTIIVYRLYLILFVLLASCNEPDSTKKKNVISPDIQRISTTQVESLDGHYIVEWKPVSQSIELNQYFKIEFFIKEPMKPINYSIDLAVDAGMLAHNHGMHTKPVVKRLGKQHFVSEGMLFHMAGKWQIELEISRGVMKDKVVIEVEL